MFNFVAYGFALFAFVTADAVWLSLMAPRLYRPTLGDIMLTGVNLFPAVLFYGLYPIGLVLFAVLPALKNGNTATAAVLGALFGFFTYATYDLTNQATLRNWSSLLSAADIGWGTVLGALAAALSFWLTGRFAS
jgi:uncharacterized membrane protein